MPALLCVKFAEPLEALARTALFPEDNIVQGGVYRVEEVQSKGTEDTVAGLQLPIDVRPFLKVAPALPKTQGKRNGHY